MNSKALFSSAGLAGIFFGVIVSVILITMLPGLRIDLTEDRLYTLSEGTRNIVSNLETPIELRFFYPKAPQKISLRSALMAAGFRNYWKKSPLPARASSL